MPDTRLPERWLLNPVYRELTDTDWRVYTWGLMFSNAQLTDGVITASALALLHPHGLQPDSYERLVEAGLWAIGTNGGYVSKDWAEVQTTKETFLAQREANKNRKRNERARKAGEPVTPVVTAAVTRDAQGKDRQGKERLGKAEAENKEPTLTADRATGEITDWDVVEIPQPIEDGELF